MPSSVRGRDRSTGRGAAYRHNVNITPKGNSIGFVPMNQKAAGDNPRFFQKYSF